MHATRSSPLRTVLVPLDGSTLAEEALPVAGALVCRAGATIHLVTVQTPLVPPGAEFGLGDIAADVAADARDDIQVYLAMMTAKLARVRGVHTVSAVLVGLPVQRLAEYAKAKAIDLIVMTTHGRGGFSRFWLGSVADQLIRQVRAPVLLLRHGSRSEDAAFRHITVALDGSPASEQVLAPTIALGSLAADAYYTLVRVVEPPAPMVTPVGLYPSYSDDQSLDQLQAAAARYLEDVAEQLRASGLPVETRVLVGGVAEQVVRFAEQGHSQLIVVGTRGARGMDRLVLGSVADKVVRSAVQPVLVVPAPPPRAGSSGPATEAAAAGASPTDNQVLTP